MKKKKLNKLDLEIYEETLDNGLRIFVIPKTDVKNVYATFTTNYGSIQNEFVPIGEKEMIKVPDGVAHFLEHKVFEQKDGKDPFEFYSKTGSDCNANTSNYKTTYLFVGQDHILENLNYLLDFVQEPYFTDENVKKEKGIIEQELKMYQDNPFAHPGEVLTYNSFIEHPIKISVGGTVESIYEITKEDLYKCYNTFYHPSNMFVCVTGNVKPKEIIKTIKDNQKNKHFDEAQKIKIKEYNEPDNVEKEEDTIYMNITIPKVMIAYKINIENTGLNRKKIANFIAFYSNLKMGPVSLLNEKLKKENIITKDIDFYNIKTDKHLLLIIEADTKKQKEFIKEIDNEIKNNNITSKEFNRQKKVGIASCLYMSDSIFSLNNAVMNAIIHDNKVNYNEYNFYKKLDYKEFNNFINNLNFDNKSILYVNPKN